MDPHPVVLFDGVCNLCTGSVAFIIRRDAKGVFRFAPLQSPLGAELTGGRAPSDGSVVLIEGGRVYTRSTAVLRIVRRLRQPWPLLAGLIVVPAPVRDWLYGIVAENRYRWFGRRDTCMTPTPELQGRFLA